MFIQKQRVKKEKKVITLSIINEFVHLLQLLINTYNTQERHMCVCVCVNVRVQLSLNDDI
jgi:hypothetical protein